MDSNAWVVPMTIGLCLDMCGIYLLSKSFSMPVDSTNINFKFLDFAVSDAKNKFLGANTILNDKEKENVEGFTPKWAYNEITRIDFNFHVLNRKFYNFNKNFLNELDRQSKANISNLLIVLFGISLIIFGTALLVNQA